MVKMANIMSCVFYHNWKRRKKKDLAWFQDYNKYSVKVCPFLMMPWEGHNITSVVFLPKMHNPKLIKQIQIEGHFIKLPASPKISRSWRWRKPKEVFQIKEQRNATVQHMILDGILNWRENRAVKDTIGTIDTMWTWIVG